MNVEWNIQLFAGLADRFGTPSLQVSLPEEKLTVSELKQALTASYPEHAHLLAISFLACNQTYASDETEITVNDELAMLPPVSGGEETSASQTPAEEEARFIVTDKPLSVDSITRQVICPANGAVLTFTGTTREWTQGVRTVRLEYEAYIPMAEKTLAQIGDEIEAKWPGSKTAIAHRIGVVDIAEISVVIAVSSPHRDTCYEASRYAIERLKQIVPIWKKEIWEDGSEWKGHQLGPWNPTAALE